MNCLVRQAQLKDAEKISLLSQQLGYNIAASSTMQNIENITQNTNEIVLVAETGNDLAGWIHAFKTTRVESGTFIEIGGLVVNDLYKRKGIGKMLVEKVRQWSIEKSIFSLRVRCNIKRKDAHEFYRALGFKENKEQKVFETSLLL